MRRRAIAITSILCLLGGVSIWTFDRITRRYRLPTYGCNVPVEFDDRGSVGRNPQRRLDSRYHRYKVYHKYGWRNAQSDWLGGAAMKSSPTPTNDFDIQAMADGKQQFYRDKHSLIRLPD